MCSLPMQASLGCGMKLLEFECGTSIQGLALYACEDIMWGFTNRPDKEQMRGTWALLHALH
jgi:hypothetical protein